ncbi:hypothetical protein P8Q88_11330 [Qipengyuania sp. XHP0207]|uniref:Rossmann fold domain-containing protein n=1 Tax=Qipengyuania sp. XHP0207 TaxID=3038078 RepID=UPI00241D183D|nr:hypothetical protein [Qipengyuania sp. XHP0207]MDG5748765.1 hypothetical protein [Qipengyuania sp. XHP0207]
MKRISVDDLPADPLAAAGLFHQHWLAHVEHQLEAGEDLLITVPSADYTHREWRRAVTAGLARKHAPRRVNMVAGEGPAIDATEAYLARAPGVTGQYLET